MKAFDVLLSLVRAVMFGEELSSEVRECLTDERIKKLYKLAKKHDIAHLAAHAILKNGIPDDSECKAPLVRERDQAMLRYMLLQHELDELSRVLDGQGIAYIPLKGSVIRVLYPEPWMRTSCDVDVLVSPEDLDAARDALVEQLGYTLSDVCTDHDISLFTRSGMHIELHYTLLEDDRRGEAVISRVWEHSHLAEDSSCRYLMSDEMFYLYHIAHMANHFTLGGCGARTLLDLYLLNHPARYDRDKLDLMLTECGFVEFERAMRELSEAWFGAGERGELLLDVEEYILTGGVYGTAGNRIAVSQVKRGGRVRYLLSRIFISNKELKRKYPILEKRPYLIPIYHVKRWLKPIFNRETTERSLGEISVSSGAEKTADRTEQLLKQLNL